MIKTLSRIFGMAGSILTMLPYAVIIWYCTRLLASPTPENCVEDGKGLAFVYLLMYIVPALLSCAGFIASFFIRKKPLAAGIIMAVSAWLNFIPMPDYLVPIYFFSPLLAVIAKVLAVLLLSVAGLLAVIIWKKARAGNEPQMQTRIH